MGLEKLKPIQYRKEMEKRLSELKRISRLLMKKSGTAPQGHLKVSQRKGCAEFYHLKEAGSAIGSYIPVSQRDFAARLAQKDYDAKLLKQVRREIWILENYLRLTKSGDLLQNLFERLCPARRTLVEAVTLSDEEYALRWRKELEQGQSVQGQRGPFSEEAPKYFTANGERVRSKSEVIIADALLRNGVPYFYEVPLKLKRSGEAGSAIFHPDFLCLNVRTRSEFYWEHFGMMGDEDYKNNAAGKLNLYAANGFFPGRNMIFTMESGEEALDTRVVEKMIREFLL